MISKKSLVWLVGAVCCFCAGAVFAAAQSGIAAIAGNVVSNLSGVAKLITAGSYVAGFGFAVAAIVKFKAHKDNPTQQPLSAAIALLFVAAALIFIPAVFRSTGITLFGNVSGLNAISGTDKIAPAKS